jgi:predicted dehydrogenase
MGTRPAGTIRVALLGFGVSGELFHGPFLATTGGLELAAVVTSDPGRQRRARALHPDTAVFATAGEVWTRAAGFDLVVLATPNRTHLPLALQALEAGLPLVIDKPLALSPEDGGHIVAAAAAKGLPLTVFQNRRWDGDFITVRTLLDDGALGDVHLFESRFERWRPVPKGGWRETESAADGGGILTDLGSHLVDQAVQLFGPVRSVYAEVAARRAQASADDDAFIALTHANGTRSHLTMSAVSGQLGPRFRLLGSRSAYVKFGMDPQEAALRAGTMPGTPDWGADPPERWGLLGVDGDGPAPVPTQPGDYGGFYAGVVAMLRDGAPPPVDPRDAVGVQQVIDAARTSATSRSVQHLR